MPDNEIISEIHRHREEVARLCEFDVDKLFAYYRERQSHFAALGHPVVSFVHKSADSMLVREEPPER